MGTCQGSTGACQGWLRGLLDKGLQRLVRGVPALAKKGGRTRRLWGALSLISVAAGARRAGFWAPEVGSSSQVG